MEFETVKRYCVSTLVTFFAGMAIVIVPSLNEGLTIDSFKDGTLVGLVFSGARFGVKMVLELFLAWYAGWKK